MVLLLSWANFVAGIAGRKTGARTIGNTSQRIAADHTQELGTKPLGAALVVVGGGRKLVAIVTVNLECGFVDVITMYWGGGVPVAVVVVAAAIALVVTP